MLRTRNIFSALKFVLSFSGRIHTPLRVCPRSSQLFCSEKGDVLAIGHVSFEGWCGYGAEEDNPSE